MAGNSSEIADPHSANSTSLNHTHPIINIFSGKYTELLAWSIVVGTMSIIGAVVNFLVLLTVWPKSSRRSSFGLLICHFVAIQLVMCLINSPASVFMIRARVDGRWLSADICSVVESIILVCAGVINWSDAGLAINRCIALFFPHRYAAWTSKPVNVCLIGGAWLGSLVGYLTPPISYGFSTVIHLSAPGYCSWAPTAAGKLGTFSSAVTTVAPYTISGIGAALILWKSSRLTRPSATVQPLGGAGLNRSLQTRLKMARMLLLTFLWTAVCITPGSVAIRYFPEALQRNQISALWLRIMQPFQYGFTPCILLLSSSEYRKRLLHMCIRNRAVARALSYSAKTNQLIVAQQSLSARDT